jgi:hypothetical protein
LRAAPAWLKRSLIAPYTLGLNFILRGDPQRLLGNSLAADIDAAFADPPSSTEQILHPDKYWGELRDEPRGLELPDLAASFGTGWRLAAAGSLGELSLGVLTGAPTPDATSAEASQAARWTNAAASGLDGDRYHHYVAGDRRATLLMTVWESKRDAEEFLDALHAVAGRRSFHAGTRVVLLAGAPEGREASLAAAALSGLRLGE